MSQNLPRQTIMLVDDDPDIRRVSRELLEYQGYRVETAGDLPTALELFQRLGRVDLVILDYHLDGQDGVGLIQALRSLDAGLRVLVISGFITSEEMVPLQKSGVQGIIYKPFPLRELQQKIWEALAGSAGGC